MTARMIVNRFILVGIACVLPAFTQTAHAGGWRFDFGFYPFWYPGPVYDYGYSDDYADYYYPDSGGYRGGSYGERSAVSVEVLVQSALARRGYYSGPVDGVIGSGTRSAIREFQNDNRLPVTGQIDGPLVQALRIGRD
jgi:Putative peptidoglycan binding domain